MKIKGVNKYLKRENKIDNQPINRYIKEKTYLDIEKEIKNHTLRVALSPEVHNKVFPMLNYFYVTDFMNAKKELFSKKDYIKVKNSFQKEKPLQFTFKIKKENLILFSSAHFVERRGKNIQLPLDVPLIVRLWGSKAKMLNKRYALIIVRMDGEKQKIYTLDGKEWKEDIAIHAYKSVR